MNVENQPRNAPKLRAGKCPDKMCGGLCFFSANQEMVECTKCGQKHSKENLIEKQDDLSAEDFQSAEIAFAKQGRKDSEAVKVNGLSNYQCKVISSLMTYYGLDKKSGSAQLLSTLPGRNETFDCSKLSSRAFVIEEKRLDIKGYGLDPIAMEYLSSVLEKIREYHKSEKYPLIPIHADGDGHCLVHAISRCLTGRELFWHPLMTNLKNELLMNLEKYKMQFSAFFEHYEWEQIIAEADPDYQPSNGEPLGLRNIHIFALANVLHRPIILLDSIDGLKSFADYSALFLPGFVSPDQCGKNGIPNKTLAIAWGSKARNHFVPLVGVMNQDVCRLPASLVPIVWGGFQGSFSEYVALGEDQSLIIAGNNSLKEAYIQEIVSCMEKKFRELNGISTTVVADFYDFVVKPNRIDTGINSVTSEAKNAIQEEFLHKCMRCGWMINYEIKDEVAPSLLPGGKLYELVKCCHGVLQDGVKYSCLDIVMRYNAQKNRLFFYLDGICHKCSGNLRLIDEDGLIKYRNGDLVSQYGSKKIFWNGRLHDHLPEKIQVDLSWKDSSIQENAFWFYKESDESKNSNAFQIAQFLVQKHYPTEFGSHVLVQRVANQILELTSHFKQDDQLQNAEKSCLQDSVLTPEAKAKQTTKSCRSHNAIKTNSQPVVKKKTEQVKPVYGNPRGATPKDASKDQSTATPKVTSSPPSKNTIRLSGKGKSATVDLPPITTYAELQVIIEDKLGIPGKHQQLKVGFPPRLISPANDGNDAVALKHGDKVLVEERQPLKEVKPVEEVKPVKPVGKRSSADDEVVWGSDTRSIPLLASISEGTGTNAFMRDIDFWDTFATEPDCFKPGGVVFSLIQQDYGTLKNGDHMEIPIFPKKVLCYDETVAEFKLCLGDRHISAQHLSKRQLKAAAKQYSSYKMPSSGQKCSITRSYGQSTHGRLKKNITAFSGKGRSLASSQNEEKPKKCVGGDKERDKEVLVGKERDEEVSVEEERHEEVSVAYDRDEKTSVEKERGQKVSGEMKDDEEVSGEMKNDKGILVEKERKEELSVEKESNEELSVEKERDEELSFEKERDEEVSVEMKEDEEDSNEERKGEVVSVEKERNEELSVEKERDEEVSVEMKEDEEDPNEEGKGEVVSVEKERNEELSLEKERDEELSFEKERDEEVSVEKEKDEEVLGEKEKDEQVLCEMKTAEEVFIENEKVEKVSAETNEDEEVLVGKEREYWNGE